MRPRRHEPKRDTACTSRLLASAASTISRARHPRLDSGSTHPSKQEHSCQPRKGDQLNPARFQSCQPRRKKTSVHANLQLLAAQPFPTEIRGVDIRLDVAEHKAAADLSSLERNWIITCAWKVSLAVLASKVVHQCLTFQAFTCSTTKAFNDTHCAGPCSPWYVNKTEAAWMRKAALLEDGPRPLARGKVDALSGFHACRFSFCSLPSEPCIIHLLLMLHIAAPVRMDLQSYFPESPEHIFIASIPRTGTVDPVQRRQGPENHNQCPLGHDHS